MLGGAVTNLIPGEADNRALGYRDVESMRARARYNLRQVML